jgi:hypothetical protein
MPYKSGMTDGEKAWQPDWPTCTFDGCIGIRVKGEEWCLAHVDTEVRETVLAALKPGAALDLRGTPFDRELLDRLLNALRSEDGVPRLGNATFALAKFSEDASFRRAEFVESAMFSWAEFSGSASFDEVKIRGGAWFEHAVMTSLGNFRAAQFSGDVGFNGARIKTSSFNGALFSGPAEFIDVQLDASASFEAAQFDGKTLFEGAQFGGELGLEADFSKAQFNHFTSFVGAQFNGSAKFDGARFKHAGSIGPLLATSRLVLDQATFEQAIVIEVASPVLSCINTRFIESATLRVRYAEVILDSAVFGKPSTITFSEDTFKRMPRPRADSDDTRATRTLSDDDFEDFVESGGVQRLVQSYFAETVLEALLDAFTKASSGSQATEADVSGANVPEVREVEAFDDRLVASAANGRSARPRLLSLNAVDVGTLTLTELDLSACRFWGAHNLDQLHIEGAQPFSTTPTGWFFGRVGGQGIPVWRWTRRQTLAEEHHWRAHRPLPTSPQGRPHPQRAGWYPSAMHPPVWLADQTGQRAQRLEPSRIAVLYRSLRTAQEDRKNEPGAADFYYGEMEMRRLASATPWGERVILALYWLISGYSLRGLRALVSLAVVVVGLATLFDLFGFPQHPSPPTFWESLLYTAQSTLSISDQTQLTPWGKLLHIAVRLAGLLLLGLALLSVRNRVKR